MGSECIVEVGVPNGILRVLHSFPVVSRGDVKAGLGACGESGCMGWLWSHENVGFGRRKVQEMEGAGLSGLQCMRQLSLAILSSHALGHAVAVLGGVV